MSNYFDDNGLIMFQCDVCGRKLNSVNYTNGMKFCAKCYQETFGETEKDRKIADLEAKLAESEKSKEINIKERDKICLEMATDYNRQIIDLQSQLVITEKALELAVKSYYRIDCISRVLGDEQFDMTEKDILKETQNYFIEQAKEMLENESK